nr:hypothetical protein [uncultured bacterium]
MNMYDFSFHIDEALALSKLDFNSKAYRRGLKKLMKEMDVDMDFLPVPGKKRWMILEVAFHLVALSGFGGLILLALNAESVSENQALAWMLAIFIYVYAALGVVIYANIRKNRLTRQYLNRRISALGERVQKIPPEDFESARTLLFHTPEILWEEEVAIPASIPCGCWKCTLAFSETYFGAATFDPVCPKCGSYEHVLYGDDEVPVTQESLQILHDLFEEEL